MYLSIVTLPAGGFGYIQGSYYTNVQELDFEVPLFGGTYYLIFDHTGYLGNRSVHDITVDISIGFPRYQSINPVESTFIVPHGEYYIFTYRLSNLEGAILVKFEIQALSGSTTTFLTDNHNKNLFLQELEEFQDAPNQDEVDVYAFEEIFEIDQLIVNIFGITSVIILLYSIIQLLKSQRTIANT